MPTLAPTISLTLEQFKREAATLLKALPTLQRSVQVQAGIDCLNIAYLGLRLNGAESGLADSVWDYASRKAIAREVELLVARA